MLGFFKMALGPTMKMMRPALDKYADTLADNTYFAVMRSDTELDDAVVAKMAAPVGKRYFDRLNHNFETNAPVPEAPNETA